LLIHDATSVATAPAAAPVQAGDELQWTQIKDTQDIGLLRQFVEQYPASRHRADAEQRVAVLAAQLGLKAVLSPGDQAGPAASDDADWAQAMSADTFDAYQAYLKSHPQGAHVEEARVAAAEVRPLANAVTEEPPIGMLPPGVSKIVDDHDPMCKRGEVKVVTGGNVLTKTVRTKKCVPRDQLP
jgi:hypothetical protein